MDFHKVLATLATLALVGALALGGYLYLASHRTLTLPAPRGPFAVGRTSFDWVDETRDDSLAPEPGHRREVMAWVWYPAEPGSAAPVAYLPEPLLSADRNLSWAAPSPGCSSMTPAGFARTASSGRPWRERVVFP